jgi:hypothetical protein
MSEKSNRIVHRMILCGLSLSLLWLTSLELSQSLVRQFGVGVPSLSSLQEVCWHHGWGVVEGQKRGYEQCVMVELEHCDAQGEAALAAEKSRVREVKQVGDAALVQVRKWEANCTTLLEAAKQAAESAGCSGSTSAMPTASPTQAPTSPLKDVISYTQSSDATVGRLAAYADALETYNSNYLRNKTKALQGLSLDIVASVAAPTLPSINASFASLSLSLDALLGCVVLGSGADNAQVCPLGITSADALYLTLQTEMEGQLAAVTSTLDAFKFDLQMFKLTLDEALASADSFFDSVAGAQGILAWIVANLDAFGAVGDMCGRSSPDWCSFSSSDWGFVKRLLPAAPSLVLFPLPDAAEVGRQLQPSLRQMKATIHEAQAETIALVGQAVTGLQEALTGADFTAGDYNPPPYPGAAGAMDNASSDAAQHREASMRMREDLSRVFNFSSASASAIADEAGAAATKATAAAAVDAANAGAALQEMAESSFSQAWSTLSHAELLSAAAEWMARLLSLQGLVVLFDFLYRGLQTMQIIRRFWSRSLGTLPDVDAQVTKGEGGEGRDNDKGTSSSLFAAACEALPYVWLQVLLVVAFVGLCVGSLLSLYLSALNSYRQACVLPEKSMAKHSSNGSFLSDNMFSAAFNYASSKAYARVSAGLGQHKSKFSSVCQQQGQASSSAAEEGARAYAQANASLHAAAAGLASLSSSCSSFVAPASSALAVLQSPDALFLACPPLAVAQDQAHTRLNVTWAAPPLPPSQAASATDAGAVFRCSAIPPCLVACSGPDQATLAQATQQCACSAEWFLHGSVAQTVLVFVVYFSINAARVLLLRALIILLWRDLNAAVFKVTLSCDEQGAVLLDGKGTGEGEGEGEDELLLFKEQTGTIRSSLASSLCRYSVKGWLFLVLGVLVCVPGAVLLYTANDALEYRQHPQSKY